MILPNHGGYYCLEWLNPFDTRYRIYEGDFLIENSRLIAFQIERFVQKTDSYKCCLVIMYKDEEINNRKV